MSTLLHQAPAESRPRRAQAPIRTQDNAPEEITIARYLLSGESPDAESVYGLPLVIRRYLSELNLGDWTWIGSPLFVGLSEAEARMSPHDFSARDREYWRGKYPNPDELVDSRFGIALEFIGEALAELQDVLSQNDLQNNRLVSAIAGAIRGELQRLVDYVDRGCPAELEDPDSEGQAVKVVG